MPVISIVSLFWWHCCRLHMLASRDGLQIHQLHIRCSLHRNLLFVSVMFSIFVMAWMSGFWGTHFLPFPHFWVHGHLGTLLLWVLRYYLTTDLWGACDGPYSIVSWGVPWFISSQGSKVRAFSRASCGLHDITSDPCTDYECYDLDSFLYHQNYASPWFWRWFNQVDVYHRPDLTSDSRFLLSTWI